RQVVLGMDTGLDGMRIGGKRRLIIPWELAYGPTAHLSIPAKSDLIFDIELIKQSDTDPNPKAPPSASAPAPAPATAPTSSIAPAAAPPPAATAPPLSAAPKP